MTALGKGRAALLSTIAYHGAPARLYPLPGNPTDARRSTREHPLAAYLTAYADPDPAAPAYAAFTGTERPPFDPETFPARYRPNPADLPIPRDVLLPVPQAQAPAISPNRALLNRIAAKQPGTTTVCLPERSTNAAYYARRYPDLEVRAHDGRVYVLNAHDSFPATPNPPPPRTPVPLPPPPGRLHLYTRTRVPFRQLPHPYTKADYHADPQAPSRFYLDLPDSPPLREELTDPGTDVLPAPLHLFAMLHAAFYTLPDDAPDLPPFPPRYAPIPRKETLR